MKPDKDGNAPWLDFDAMPDYVRDRFAAAIADCITRMLRDPDIRAEIMPETGENSSFETP